MEGQGRKASSMTTVSRRSRYAFGLFALSLSVGGCSGTIEYGDAVTGNAALHQGVDGCFELTGTVREVTFASGEYAHLANSIGERMVIRYEFDWPQPATILGDSLTQWQYPVDGSAAFSSTATVGGELVESGCSHTPAFDAQGQLDKIQVGTTSWSIQDWQSSGFGSQGCQSNAVAGLQLCPDLSLEDPIPPHPEECTGLVQMGVLGFTPRGQYRVLAGIESIETCGVSDSDGDGVLDDADLCPDTVLSDDVPTRRLGVNRFADVDGDGVFDTSVPNGKQPARSYTIADTHGCNCAQIIEAAGLGRGHEKFGCSIGEMDDWVAGN